MTFCTTVSDRFKTVIFAGGALVATGTFAAAEYLFSTLPSIAKVFGENCPASVVNPPEVCNAILRDYSRSFLWMVALNGTALTAAAIVNCTGPRLGSDSSEAIPLTNETTEHNTKKVTKAVVTLGAGCALVQLIMNAGLAALTKDVAISLGRCVTQNATSTLLTCQPLESGVYSLTTTDYVISAVTGLFMAGTFVWGAREAYKANRRRHTLYL